MVRYLICCVLVVLVLPLMLVVAVVVFADTGLHPIFTQQRAGLSGFSFTIYKFRTMRKEGQISLIGRFFRKFGIDEFPQLFNILKRDMNFIGPRPLLPHYSTSYDLKQSQRLLILPGITGWAQVHGRNNLSWEQKFEYDVWYVHNQSLLLDVKILILTIVQIFSRKDSGDPSKLFS